MIKTYKFRLYPDKEQENILKQFIGASRFIYNHYLYEKTRLYREQNKSFELKDMKKDLKRLEIEYEWLTSIDGSILRTTLDDLNQAYDKFFKGISGYPKYKKKSINGSYRTPCIIGHYKNKTYQNIKIDLKNRLIKLPKIKEEIKFRGYRNLKSFPDKIYNATIIKKGQKYYVSICVEENVILPEFIPKYSIGIDLGIKDLVVTSDGLKYKNECNIKKYEKKIKGLQRWLSRCERGSKNRLKVLLKLNRVYEKLRNARKFTLHQISKKITDENDIIVTEKLKISNMLKNHHLSKSITDASWYHLIKQLEYKSKWKNKKFYQIDTFYPSSQICSCCDNKNNKVKDLKVRKWICDKCGMEHDRDINASVNIMIKGIERYVIEELN